MCFQFCSTGIPATGFCKLDPVLSRWSSPLLWIASHPHLRLSLLFHHTEINYHTLIPKQRHDTPQSCRNNSWHSFYWERITLLSNILGSKWNIFFSVIELLLYLSHFLWYLRAMCHIMSSLLGLHCLPRRWLREQNVIFDRPCFYYTNSSPCRQFKVPQFKKFH